jgi:hypothetical protein
MTKRDQTASAHAPAGDHPAAIPAMPYVPVLTPMDLMLQAERLMAHRRLASDDARRAAAGTTKLRAITGFTIFGDPGHPEGRAVNRGDEIEVSDFDLPRYIGKARPIEAEQKETPA